LAHPDIEKAMVGHQGDVWDPQRDMASAFYGSLVYVGYLAWSRTLHEEKAPTECVTDGMLDHDMDAGQGI
jgi:hypothetical protein